MALKSKEGRSTAPEKSKRGAAYRSRAVTTRLIPDGPLPLVSCEGTAFECGEQLGGAWKEALAFEAGRMKSDTPWWKDRRYAKLISKYAPHLPDLFRGMAAGSGLKEDLISTRAPAPDVRANERTRHLRSRDAGGCTSFAIAPDATVDGCPISGQTKDVSVRRGMQMLILRLKIKDGPSALTLTYPGWLFGHGFVRGGTAIFRNSLFGAKPQRGLPLEVWGMVALHCPTVEHVMKLTRDYGFEQNGHMTVSDERGGIVGIENMGGVTAFLKPRRGIYAHANCVLAGRRLRVQEQENADFGRSDSLHRVERMYAQLEPERGRLTAQLAYRALCDHDGFPLSICRHQGAHAMTAAIVLAEPARGILHATRTLPCQSWPRTYAL